MNNPYKIAGNILSGTSTFHDDFSSIDLYGAAVQKKNENAICSTFHLENESGIGNISVYQAFPGVELVYNDMHMEYCNKTRTQERVCWKSIIAGKVAVNALLENKVTAIWQRIIYPFVLCRENHIHHLFLRHIIME